MVIHVQSGYGFPAKLALALWFKALSSHILSKGDFHPNRCGNLRLSAIRFFHHTSQEFCCIGHPSPGKTQLRSTRAAGSLGQEVWVYSGLRGVSRVCRALPEGQVGRAVGEARPSGTIATTGAGRKPSTTWTKERESPLLDSVTCFSHPARPGFYSATLFTNTS